MLLCDFHGWLMFTQTNPACLHYSFSRLKHFAKRCLPTNLPKYECYAPKCYEVGFVLLNKKLNAAFCWMAFIIVTVAVEVVVQLVIVCICSAITVKHSNKLFLRHCCRSNKLSLDGETSWVCSGASNKRSLTSLWSSYSGEDNGIYATSDKRLNAAS